MRSGLRFDSEGRRTGAGTDIGILLRDDILVPWRTERGTVARQLAARPTAPFATHSVGEAVRLSSRICMIVPRPGRIDRIIGIDLPFPRDLEAKQSREPERRR